MENIIVVDNKYQWSIIQHLHGHSLLYRALKLIGSWKWEQQYFLAGADGKKLEASRMFFH